MVLALEEIVLRAFKPNLPTALGIAVSGGSDSVALLHILAGLRGQHDVKLRAVTVDHRLRAEAAQEARQVGVLCEGLGVPHDVLEWRDWDGSGNLQNEARAARYALMGEWARRYDLPVVALGHTANDQAETVLMRLARRAGVDGLSGMPARHAAHDVDWVRPLLRISRQDLRDYLMARDVVWSEDPSNDDLGYDRIKARRALEQLSVLGIDVETLTVVADNMSDARKALDWQSFLAAREFGCIDAGAVVYSARKMRTQPDEIQRRLLVHAIRWIMRKDYPPRREAIASVRHRLEQGTGSTVDGCQIVIHQGQVWIFREYNAVANLRDQPYDVWDGRWRLHCTEPVLALAGLEVRALGAAGLSQLKDWRDTQRPRAMLMGSPSVWQGERLLAAPAANPGDTWRAELENGEEAFFVGLLSH